MQWASEVIMETHLPWGTALFSRCCTLLDDTLPSTVSVTWQSQRIIHRQPAGNHHSSGVLSCPVPHAVELAVFRPVFHVKATAFTSRDVNPSIGTKRAIESRYIMNPGASVHCDPLKLAIYRTETLNHIHVALAKCISHSLVCLPIEYIKDPEP